jgi:hypothetical protein
MEEVEEFLLGNLLIGEEVEGVLAFHGVAASTRS